MRLEEFNSKDEQLDELLGSIGRGVGKLAGGAATGVGAVAGGIAGLGTAFKKGYQSGKAVTSGDSAGGGQGSGTSTGGGGSTGGTTTTTSGGTASGGTGSGGTTTSGGTASGGTASGGTGRGGTASGGTGSGGTASGGTASGGTGSGGTASGGTTATPKPTAQGGTALGGTASGGTGSGGTASGGTTATPKPTAQGGTALGGGAVAGGASGAATGNNAGNDQAQDDQPAADTDKVSDLQARISKLDAETQKDIIQILQKQSASAKEPEAEKQPADNAAAGAQAQQGGNFDAATGKPTNQTGQNLEKQIQDAKQAKAQKMGRGLSPQEEKEIEGNIRGTMKPKAAPAQDDNPNIVKGTESVQRREKMVREYTEKFSLFKPQTVRATLKESRKTAQKIRLYR
jgi:hypothetical protein